MRSRQGSDRGPDPGRPRPAESGVVLPFPGATAPGGGEPEAPAARLQAQPTPLIGRECELAAGQELLLRPDVRLVTLLGPPGIGKTRLALALADAVAERFSQGATFIDLAAVRDADLVLAGIAEGLGLLEAADQPWQERLERVLEPQHRLLVLDNFEQLIEAAGRIAHLLSRCPELTLLVTSRIPLGIRWEQQMRLAPLAVPARSAALEPRAIAGFSGVALFLARAEAIGAQLSLNADNARTVAELCRLLDGLPLAIELAAAQADLLPPAEILAGLQRYGSGWLVAAEGDQDPRHRTIQRAIDWSHELLRDEERRFYRRLGVFEGGFTVEAASAVCGDPASPPSALPQPLAALVRASVVWQEPGAGDAARFRMPETIREHALDRLAASGERDLTRDRHAEHYLALAERADAALAGPEQVTWLKRLDREIENLRAALRWTQDRQQAAVLGCRLAAALARFWEMRGYLVEGRGWLEAMIPRSEQVPPGVRAALLAGAGTIAWREGRFEDAASFHERSLALSRQLGDRRGTALELNHLAVLVHEQGDSPRAAAMHREGLALTRELGDAEVLGMVLNNLGLALMETDVEGSRAAFEEALALSRPLGNKLVISALVMNLGELAHRSGKYERALQLNEESLDLARQIEDRAMIAFAMEEIAGTWAALGRAGSAVRLFGAADALREAIGAPLPPVYREFYDRALGSAQTAIGERRSRVAWAGGRTMGVDEAVAYGRALPPLRSDAAGPRESADALTPRELEIAALVARGLTNRGIAQVLVISEGTAGVHVKHILEKLQLTSRAQVAVWAVQEGLLAGAN